MSISYLEIDTFDHDDPKEQNTSLNKLEDLSFRFLEVPKSFIKKSFKTGIPMNGSVNGVLIFRYSLSFKFDDVGLQVSAIHCISWISRSTVYLQIVTS